jgi:hypothetical protein
MCAEGTAVPSAKKRFGTFGTLALGPGSRLRLSPSPGGGDRCARRLARRRGSANPKHRVYRLLRRWPPYVIRPKPRRRSRGPRADQRSSTPTLRRSSVCRVIRGANSAGDLRTVPKSRGLAHGCHPGQARPLARAEPGPSVCVPKAPLSLLRGRDSEPSVLLRWAPALGSGSRRRRAGVTGRRSHGAPLSAGLCRTRIQPKTGGTGVGRISEA